MSPSVVDSKLCVAVLAGGDSAERAVSLQSGQGVAAALAAGGHAATLVDPARRPLDQVGWSAFDACFIALHGGAGEDGRVQRQLERWGVPYTGSGPTACRLAMSKSTSKQRFAARGVPTPRWELFDETATLAEAMLPAARLGYPLVVKPDAQGSSLGVAVAEDPEQLAAAWETARSEGGPTIVEPRVRGREFTVALLDRLALPTIEIVNPEPVFSYDAKYHSRRAEYRFDFALDGAAQEAIRRAAKGAAGALGTAGLVRVDVMLSDERPLVLEVNAIPGLTPRSLAPLAAARAGIDMPDLCEWLVRRCLAPAGAL